MFLDCHNLNSIVSKPFDSGEYIVSEVNIRVNLWLLQTGAISIVCNTLISDQHCKQKSSNTNEGTEALVSNDILHVKKRTSCMLHCKNPKEISTEILLQQKLIQDKIPSMT